MIHSNLIAQRSLIPAIHHSIPAKNPAGAHTIAYTFVTGVFAVEAFANIDLHDLQRLWDDKPQGRIDGERVELVL